jgi:hypothetical protein
MTPLKIILFIYFDQFNTIFRLRAFAKAGRRSNRCGARRLQKAIAVGLPPWSTANRHQPSWATVAGRPTRWARDR